MVERLKIIFPELSDFEKLRIRQKIVKNLLLVVINTDLGPDQVVYHKENYPINIDQKNKNR